MSIHSRAALDVPAVLERRADGARPPADPLPAVEHRDVGTTGLQREGTREPGHAGTHHDHTHDRVQLPVIVAAICDEESPDRRSTTATNASAAIVMANSTTAATPTDGLMVLLIAPSTNTG